MEKLLTKPNLILFDLDGTLYESKSITRHIFHRELKNTNKLYGLLKTRDSFRNRDFHNRDEFYSHYYTNISKLSNEKQETIKKWYQERFFPQIIQILHSKYSPRDGFLDLLTSLKNRGIKTACVSDYEYVSERLTALNIDPNLFDCLIDSCSVGALKPNPRVYLTAIEKLNEIPATSLVVGDSLKFDGEAAKRANIPYLIGGNKNKRTPWNEIINTLNKITETT